MKIAMPNRLLAPALLLAAVSGASARAADAAPSVWETPEGAALQKALDQAKYQFTDQVRAAYLAMVRAETDRALAAEGKTPPPEFMAWVKKDPLIEATVYGTRPQADRILLELCALWLDIGAKKSATYKQLLLAAAVVCADDGPKADISPRKPMTLAIPQAPMPANTEATDRPLDDNDHVINWMKANPIESQVQEGFKRVVEPAEFEIDPKNRFKKPVLKKPATVKKEANMVMRKHAASPKEVIMDTVYRNRFNEYMQAKGSRLALHTGTMDFSDVTESPEKMKVFLADMAVFTNAYAAKGFYPAKRDPLPSAAETCVFLIRNDEFKFPSTFKGKWPQFPLASAPWPVLTPLIENRLPLREAEDIWQEFGKHGNNAFTETLRDAAEWKPPPFGAGSWQAARRDNPADPLVPIGMDVALGKPAMQAKNAEYGFMSHAEIRFDSQKNYYTLTEGAWAPGYPARWVSGWPFGANPQTGMVPLEYRAGIVHAVNFNTGNYLDSAMALNLWSRLPEDLRQKNGFALLTGAMRQNPYNLQVADAMGAQLDTPRKLMEAITALEGALQGAHRLGCPPAIGHLGRWMGRFASLPVPADMAEARKIHDFLKLKKHPDSALMLRYQAASSTAKEAQTSVDKSLAAHVAGVRTPAACQKMAKDLLATAGTIADTAKKEAWLRDMQATLNGHEDYLMPVPVPNTYAQTTSAGGQPPPVVVQKIMLDETAKAVADALKQDLKSEEERRKGFFEKQVAALRKHAAGKRDPLACQTMACQITAMAAQIKDSPSRIRWSKELGAAIEGNDAYLSLVPLGKDKNAQQFADKILNDESATAIAAIRNATPEMDEKRWGKPLAELHARFKQYVFNPRTPEMCDQMEKLVAGLAGQIKDEPMRRKWLMDLCKAIHGNENYRTKNGLTTVTNHDKTADTLVKLLEAMSAKGKPNPAK